LPVFGATENFRFASAGITGEALYTHAFGSPGRYEWRDANQGAVREVVNVKPRTVKTREERQRCLEEVKKPNVIEIYGDSLQPETQEIAIALTVFWHIQRAPGITITDSRLLQPTADSTKTR
jgi:hypothetical protein